MLSTKNESIKPLLESTTGIHLTAYIRNHGDLADLKYQLKDTILLASSYLRPAMKESEIKKFLEPIQLLIKEDKHLHGFNGNIGIFRTTTSFRLINIPVMVDNICIVADSFHVKPLLKWMQVDREFLLLGLDSKSATLYQGDLNTFKKVDSVQYPNQSPENLDWLNDWILNLKTESRPRLFVAGSKEITRLLMKTLQYENAHPIAIDIPFAPKKASLLCSEIRSLLKAEARKSFEKALVNFHYASSVNLADSNVFTIARAAVQGKIKKLLIADSVKIFGKLDRRNGNLVIHRADLDHEDDDILDDLAQAVLAHGGEVTIAARSDIPKGRPVLAIMDEPNHFELTSSLYEERRVI